MFFKKKNNRSVSAKKIKAWADKQQLEKVVELLESGNKETKMLAVKFLSEINMANVKRELVKALQDSDKEIALLVAEKLEYMGVNPDERVEIAKCRKRWKSTENNAPKKNIEGFLLEDEE